MPHQPSCFQGASAKILASWANMKLELDRLAYSTMEFEGVSNSAFHKSLVEELGAVERRTLLR